MSMIVQSERVSPWSQMRQSLSAVFKGRDLFLHDGATMRRFHLSAKTQMTAAGAAGLLSLSLLFNIGQAAVQSFNLTDAAASSDARASQIADLESKLTSLRSEVALVKTAAKDHAGRLEARHAAFAALVNGDADAKTVAAMVPAIPDHQGPSVSLIERAFASVDSQQSAMAALIKRQTDARYNEKAGLVSSLGINPAGLGGMGGPYEPLPADSDVSTGKADPNFKALFESWKRLDRLETSMVAIPSD